MCLFSDRGGVWRRHWNGEVFQHQVSLLGSSAERGSPSDYGACTEDARRWSNCHCGRSVTSRVFARGRMPVQFTVVVRLVCHSLVSSTVTIVTLRLYTYPILCYYYYYYDCYYKWILLQFSDFKKILCEHFLTN